MSGAGPAEPTSREGVRAEGALDRARMIETQGGRSMRTLAIVLGVAALSAGIWLFYLVFVEAPAEGMAGSVGWIYYLHMPSALTAHLAFGVAGVCSAGYLLRKDDRLDAVGVSAVELGAVFAAVALIQGAFWARLGWGEWWVWAARTTSTLILALICVAYFVTRNATENPERGKRFAAIVGVIGIIDIPFIGMSVEWFRAQYPDAAVLGPEGIASDPEVWKRVFTGGVAFGFTFFALLLYRYGRERMRRQVDAMRLGAAA